MDSVDLSRNGKINYTEFVAASLEEGVIFEEDNILKAFKMLDYDGNGVVSK